MYMHTLDDKVMVGMVVEDGRKWYIVSEGSIKKFIKINSYYYLCIN